MAAPSGAAIAARFGDNLRHARKGAGLSQEEAGIRASLHRTEVGLLERGERIPRIDTAIKLAGAVGVHVGELVAGVSGRRAARKSGRSRCGLAPRQSHESSDVGHFAFALDIGGVSLSSTNHRSRRWRS